MYRILIYAIFSTICALYYTTASAQSTGGESIQAASQETVTAIQPAGEDSTQVTPSVTVTAVQPTSGGNIQVTSQETVPADSDSTEKTPVNPFLIDIYHPKQFLEVYEVDKKGNRFLIFSRDSTDKCLIDKVEKEVGIESRIMIEFDRQWIFNKAKYFDANINIKGQVKGEKGVRNIEVPGYALVGSESKTASAQIRSATELIGILEALDIHERELYKIFGDTSPIDDNIVTVAASLPPENLKVIREHLLAIKNLVAIPLEKLSSEQDLVKILSRNTDRNKDPDYINQLAKDILEKWYPFLEQTERSVSDGANAARKDTIAQSVGHIYKNLYELAKMGWFEDNLPNEVAKDFITALKDTDILVSLTGAKVDDEIIITISNGVDQSGVDRSLTLNLTVKQFGLIAEIRDSFMFIKRLGTSSETPKQEASPGANGETPPGANGATPPGTGGTTPPGTNGETPPEASAETPREVNFEPTPGATLGWTWKPRKEQNIILNWLQPGFGINVSFPKFGSSISSVGESTTTNSTDSTMVTNTLRTITVNETDGSSIDAAAGIVGTLFDNSLTFTVGLNLTSGSGRNRWYFGVGFSFINLIRK